MKSPFKFLDSFTKEDREIFFGREKEIEELYRRVFRSKIMLVYGVSGTGKSSLINCGLANKFRDEDWLPLNIRRGKNILESMYASIVAASLTPKSEYSATEIQFKKYVKSLYLDHYKPIFFIFDQFEELFIFGSKEEKSLFVRVIKTLIDSDIQCRFIFVMREEYMANVTEFERHIPVFFSNRVRIENMDLNNAAQAIIGPCKVFNINIEEGFSEALIKILSPDSPEIELTYLQVFLDKIYRLATEEQGDKKSEDLVISFTLDQLQKIGDVSDLLGSFLNEQISLLDDPDSALAVLKSFVSVKGTKRQMSLDDVKDYAQTLGKPIKESVLLEMIQNFVNLRILRDKDQHERYELRHDSLATKIYEKISVVEKDILEIRQFIEDGWHNWKKRNILLTANDLDYIAPYESRLYLSSELLSLITQSKNQLEKVKIKRREIFFAATFVLLILFAGFTIWALLERKTSIAQETIARGNYYNALSKDIVNTDPTKALRIAEYACKLDPSENNFQNLVDIYSNNEFYHTFLPTKSLVASGFKVLQKSGNIAVNSNRRILIINPQGNILRRTTFELPLNFSFDISPNEKKYLVYTYDDSLRVYDELWNLKSKVFFKDTYVVQAFFSTDSDVVITAVNTKTERGKIKLWTLNGTVAETKESYSNGFLIQGFFSDTIRFLIEPMDLYCWIPSKDQLIKKPLKFHGSGGIISAQYLSKDRMAFLTDDDTFRICTLNGTCLKSICISDDKNSGFSRFDVMTNADLMCFSNNKAYKIYDKNGQEISILKLENASSGVQYNISTKELLILNNNEILGFVPNNLQNELVLRKESKNSSYGIRGNNIIEYVDTNRYLISFEGDKFERKALIYDRNKFWYKIPGTQNVVSRFPKNYKPPTKPEVTIYNVLDNKPLLYLKGLTEIPGRIAFSKNESLIISWNKMFFNENGFDDGPTTFFSLFNTNGDLLRTFPIGNLYYPEIRISVDNRNILSTYNKIAILWDTAGNQLYKYIGHNSNIQNADISEDGKYVLTVSYDRTARLWTREGKLLKVIRTEMDYPKISFLSGGSVFQIDEGKSVKLYNTYGALIQKIPSDGNQAIYFPENRFLYYTDNSGIHRTRIKEPVDSFILSNNHNNLSITNKIEFDLLSVKDILKSNNPNDLYLAARYFYNNIDKKVDISEKKYTLKIAEKLFQKGLTFDTLHGPISRSLIALCIQKNQFFGESINKEVDRYSKIMSETKNIDDLILALSFYVNGTDSATILYEYPEKAIMISEKLLKLFPSEINRSRISLLCSNLSFSLFDYKEQYKNSLIAVKIAIKADSTNLFSYTNLPLSYIYNNMYSEAEKEYLKLKDKPFTVDQSINTFKEAFLGDFADLERRGKGHPDFAKIKELLKK